MTASTASPNTNLGVAMFTVADQDAALAFYTEKLGFEVRADVNYAEGGSARWLEVAPPGSTARLAINPPMDGTPGGSAIGVEVGEPMSPPGAPTMFSVSDLDGNFLWVVGTPA